MIKFLLFFIICFPNFIHAKLSNEVMEKEVNGQKLKYLLSVPEGKPDKNGWPILLFLHGAGERGNDLEKVKVHGPPKLINKFPQLKNAIVISPQCPTDSCWNTLVLMSLMNLVFEEFNGKINSNRIYVTGLSLGGYGVWHLISQYPEVFAAAAPICGGGDVSKINGNFVFNNAEKFDLQKLKSAKLLPVWVFHGSEDTVVPQKESEFLVEALKEVGNKSVKFTSYKGVGHDSWTKTYNNPDFYKWLFSHRRKK